MAAVDWQATIGQGYAYRFSTLGTLIRGHWPEGYTSLVVSLKQSGVPFAWDPVGAIVMSIPVALVLAAARRRPHRHPRARPRPLAPVAAPGAQRPAAACTSSWTKRSFSIAGGLSANG